MMINSFNLKAQDIERTDAERLMRYTIPLDHVDRLKELAVEGIDKRIVPFDVYCNQILKFISNRTEFKAFTPTQAVMGFLLYPEIWGRVPLIYQTDTEISYLIGSGDMYISYFSLFNGKQNYTLTPYLRLTLLTPQHEMTDLDKKILLFNEKKEILTDLTHAKFIPVFPIRDQKRWASPGDKAPSPELQSQYWENEELFAIYLNQLIEAIRTNNWAYADTALDNVINAQRESGVINPILLHFNGFFIRNNIRNYIAYAYIVICVTIIILLLITLFYSNNKYLIRVTKYLSTTIYGLYIIQVLFTAIVVYMNNFRMSANEATTEIYYSFMLASIAIFLRKKFLALKIGLITLASYILITFQYGVDGVSVFTLRELENYWLLKGYLLTLDTSVVFLTISSVIAGIALIGSILNNRFRIEFSISNDIIQTKKQFLYAGFIALLVAIITRLTVSFILYPEIPLWYNDSIWLAGTAFLYLFAYSINNFKQIRSFQYSQALYIIACIIMITSYRSLI
ncbi:MAG: hypothetical protein ACRCXN_02375 [Bacteroidales bacterium]